MPSETVFTQSDLEWLISLPEEDLDEWLEALSADARFRVYESLNAFLEQGTPEYKERLEGCFYEFVKEAWSLVDSHPFVPNWHLRCIADHLQSVHDGEITKLLINIPPGCSKSILCGVLWPAWRWAKDASVSTIGAAYQHQLAVRDAVKSRSLVESSWYRAMWGEHVVISEVQNEKANYATTAGGYRMSTTPRGRGTGDHPSVILGDDLHSAKKAESETERQSIIDWWDLTITTRGVGIGSARVIVMQRLHENDISGHVLAQGGWLHVMLPMEFEPDRRFMSHILNSETGEPWCDPRTEEGELLWPSFFTPEKVADMKRGLGAYGSAGQLQQRPAPRKGGMFDTGKMLEVDADFMPQDFDALVRYWDKAGTEDGGCFTAGVLMARKGAGKVYVLDVITDQLSGFKVEELIERTAKLDELRWGLLVETVVEQEGGSGGKFQAAYTEMRLKGSRVSSDLAKDSKELRAGPWAIAIEAGDVVVLKDAPWLLDFITEHITFPRGSRKDQVDAASGAYRRLMCPETVRVSAADLQGCVRLTGPALDSKGGYTTAVGAIVYDQMQTFASFVVMGVNVPDRKVGLMHFKKWERLEANGYRIPAGEVATHVADTAKKLGAAAVVYDPTQCERLGSTIAEMGVTLYKYPLDSATRKNIAAELLNAMSNRSVDLYHDERLFAELLRLPIKKNVDGFSIEATSDGSGPLDSAVAFAVCNRWAFGTLEDYLSE